MRAGKLSNEQLKNIILKQITYKREDVVLRSDVGEDCAGIAFGDEVCLLTTDPITGSASEVGKLAVHISCNDIASNGAAPVAILLTILAPIGTTEEELSIVMEQAHEEALKLQVEIVGGHTEITSAVNRIVVSSTALGKQKKEKVVSNRSVKLGDQIIMTKYVGLEGTGIIAFEKESELEFLSMDSIQKAKACLDHVSVVKEGVIVGKIGYSSMHDITEGGLLGAVWEICEGAGLGAIISHEHIPILEVTKSICNHYNINPLRLISSGTMLITADKNKTEDLLTALNNEQVLATVIGEITEKDVYLEKQGRLRYVTPPESDELYKVVK